ncbi:hypothetical protein V1512DRAFT_217952 [Lipomyces arxii]|uniref:uncharacterized protein n=1 Tax=Lipomyces arxii TaxID=56418 RepID=UPI0034CEB752
MTTVTETGSSLVLQNTASTADLTIGLHPLAILNMSDFYTRAHLSRTDLLGGLIGKQSGRDVSIEQTFEFNLIDGLIDEATLDKKLEQFKACFEDLEFVGWFYIPLQSPYEPTKDILPVHQYLSKYHNDTPPLFLVFNPNLSNTGTQKLPITIYETFFIEDGKPQFVEVQHRIDSFEAEHIGVLYVAKQDTIVNPDAQMAETPESSEKAEAKNKKDSTIAEMDPEVEETIAQLNAQANAVKMLHSRLDIMQKYLNQISETPDETLQSTDFEILKQIDGLVGRLSTSDIAAVAQGQRIDGLLAGLLGEVTKGVKFTVDLNAKRQTLDSQRPGHPNSPFARM